MKCIKCGKEAIALIENKVLSKPYGIIIPQILEYLCLEAVCKEHYDEFRKIKEG